MRHILRKLFRRAGSNGPRPSVERSGNSVARLRRELARFQECLERSRQLLDRREREIERYRQVVLGLDQRGSERPTR